MSNIAGGFPNAKPFNLTLYGAGTAGTPTTPVANGSIILLDKMVIANFRLASTSLTGMAGEVRIGGFPYTCSETYIGSGGFSFWSGVTLTTLYTDLALIMVPGQAYASLRQSGSAQVAAVVDTAQLTAASFDICGWLIYTAA